jgi:demethylspheroidene O-methyltransferase
MYLLAMGRGQPRTEAQLTALLKAAGFRAIRRIATRMPLQASILVATAALLGELSGEPDKTVEILV